MNNILENNMKIAIFMGGKKINIKDYYDNDVVGVEFYKWKPPSHEANFWNDELRFHSSWDWLMPVVDAIESINLNGDRFDVNINNSECQIFGVFEDIAYSDENVENAKMYNTWTAVIQFIDWYKEKTK